MMATITCTASLNLHSDLVTRESVIFKLNLKSQFWICPKCSIVYSIVSELICSDVEFFHTSQAAHRQRLTNVLVHSLSPKLE